MFLTWKCVLIAHVGVLPKPKQAGTESARGAPVGGFNRRPSKADAPDVLRHKSKQRAQCLRVSKFSLRLLLT